MASEFHRLNSAFRKVNLHSATRNAADVFSSHIRRFNSFSSRISFSPCVMHYKFRILYPITKQSSSMRLSFGIGAHDENLCLPQIIQRSFLSASKQQTSTADDHAQLPQSASALHHQETEMDETEHDDIKKMKLEKINLIDGRGASGMHSRSTASPYFDNIPLESDVSAPRETEFEEERVREYAQNFIDTAYRLIPRILVGIVLYAGGWWFFVGSESIPDSYTTSDEPYVEPVSNAVSPTDIALDSVPASVAPIMEAPQLASRFRRFSAVIADAIISGMVGSAVFFIVASPEWNNAIIVALATMHEILLPWYTNGQTFGKRLFNMRTVREDGKPLSLLDALYLWLLKASNALFMMDAGWSLINWKGTKKCFHNMLTKTLVIQE